MEWGELERMLEGYANVLESEVLVGSIEVPMELPRWDAIMYALDLLGRDFDPNDAVPASPEFGLNVLAALVRNEFFALDSGMSRRESVMLASRFVQKCFFERPWFYTLGRFHEFEEDTSGRITYISSSRARLFRNGGLEAGVFIVDEVQVGLVCVSDFF
jgi:hypothetical protein